MTSQKIIFLVVAFLAVGCVSPSTSRMVNLDYPLLNIQRGIKKSFPVDFKNVSRDGTWFESYPFVRSGQKLIPAASEIERGRAIIEIRGVERPYTVDVTIEIEEATSPNSVQKNFKVVGYDDVVAKIFLARLKAYLLKSKKSGNIVDDFRAF